jgi:hypothetical protein
MNEEENEIVLRIRMAIERKLPKIMEPVNEIVETALNETANAIHGELMDMTGDAGAHSAEVWQRIRSQLEDKLQWLMEAQVERVLGAELKRELDERGGEITIEDSEAEMEKYEKLEKAGLVEPRRSRR